MRRPIHLPARYTVADAEAFVRSARQAARRGEGFDLAIVLREESRLIGMARLGGVLGGKREGHLGYWIARPYWGHGYASEAASRLCRLAFGPLRLRRLATEVLPSNRRSIAVLERLGFRREGVERQAYRFGARWVDAFRFGLLADEFRPFEAPARPRPRAKQGPGWRTPRQAAPAGRRVPHASTVKHRKT